MIRRTSHPGAVVTSNILICGNTCGHNHEGINSPTGCCAEHGPFMWFCGECSRDRADRQEPQ